MVSGFQACNFYNSPRACRLGTSERRSTNQLCLVGLYSWQLTQVNPQVTQLEVRKVRNVFKLHQLNLHNVFFAEKAPKSALSRWLGVEVHRRKKPIMLITACRVHEASTNSKQAQEIHYLVTMSSGCFKGECRCQRRMQMCHTHSSHAPKRKGKVKGNKHMNLLKKLVRVPISFKTQCSDCTNYSVKHCETVSSTKGAQRSSSGRHLKNRMHLLEFAKKDASRSEICRVCSRGAFADLLPSVSCKGGRSYHLERTSDKVEHSLVKCISSSPYFQLQMPKTAQGHLSVQT